MCRQHALSLDSRLTQPQTDSSSFHVLDSLSTQVTSKANQRILQEARRGGGEHVNSDSIPCSMTHQPGDLDLVT